MHMLNKNLEDMELITGKQPGRFIYFGLTSYYVTWGYFNFSIFELQL